MSQREGSAKSTSAALDQKSAKSTSGAEPSQAYNTEVSLKCESSYFDPEKSTVQQCGPSMKVEKGHLTAMASDTTLPEMIPTREKSGRKLYIIRHGERMDRIFPGWTKLAFTDQGKYRPYDLNQPIALPHRQGGPQHYEEDPPITEMGHVTSQMVGRGMRLNRVQVNRIYCSPALRCIQTAYGLLKTLNMAVKICIEPGLFEWTGWFETPPTFMSLDELNKRGYCIDSAYIPIMPVEELLQRMKETTAEHYERIHLVTVDILKQNPGSGAVLIVGHGTNMDACTRKLLGRSVEPQGLSRADMDRMGVNFPCCSLVAIEEMKNGSWKPIQSPIPPITYLDFSNRINTAFFNRP